MALETGTYINSLNAANPAATDGLSQADDHLRLLKSTIKSTFPNVDGAMTATEVELNVLDGVTATTSELNTLDGFTGTVADLNYAKDLRATGVTDTEFNRLDGLTASSSELNKMDGCTASTTELNRLDGLTASTTELNYVDGVTSAIQTQLNSKAPLASPSLTGTPTAPTASVSTDSTQVATTAFVRNIVPSGVIMMWSGAASAIPSGYVLCNGSNSTPDLRGRFVIGAQGDSGNTYDVGDTGGAASVTLSTSNMPSHTHSFSDTTSSAGAHTHSITDPGHDHYGLYYSAGDGGDNGGPATGNDSYNNSGNSQNLGTTTDTTGISINSGGAHTHSISGTTGSSGSGSAFDTVPPYYALCYIMKT